MSNPKLWSRRFAQYRSGVPIPKSLIIAACSQIRRHGPRVEDIYPLTAPDVVLAVGGAQ